MNLTPELDKIRVDSAALAALCRRYSVKELSLFGSAVRGVARASAKSAE
jgi:predicted nucleotidyltransferase